MRIDIIKDASHLPGRQPASVRNWRTLRRAVAAQHMHSQRGGKPLQIQTPTHAPFAQLAPSEPAEPPDHRVIEPNGSLDCEITWPVEGLLPDLRYEGLLDRECEERR